MSYRNQFVDFSKPSQIDQLPHSLLNPLTQNPIRAPSPIIHGTTTQCGSALATEIDTYRRRIQTLIHFFDCIAQHWWDCLHPYKQGLIKRPSKSADEVRSHQTRLLSRLAKFTMRSVIPSAAAIALMEAHATIKVLPTNLLGSFSNEALSLEVPSVTDNSATLLYKACNLARHLGDIEKLKQRMILAALTWITSDGRDFALRKQRVSLLAHHAEPCLIENFAGLKALLTHYYRPRVVVRKHCGKSGLTKPIPVACSEPITASKLTSTSEQILMAFEQARPKTVGESFLRTSMNLSAINQGLTEESFTDSWHSGLSISSGFDQANILSQRLESGRVDRDSGTTNVDVPVLPSIILNPLSIDTSQIEWLSYEVNEKEFNLHVLNTEEPQDAPISDAEWLKGMQYFDIPLRMEQKTYYNIPSIKSISGSPIPWSHTFLKSRPLAVSSSTDSSKYYHDTSLWTLATQPSSAIFDQSAQARMTKVETSQLTEAVSIQQTSQQAQIQKHIQQLRHQQQQQQQQSVSLKNQALNFQHQQSLSKRKPDESTLNYLDNSILSSENPSDSALSITTLTAQGEGFTSPNFGTSSPDSMRTNPSRALVSAGGEGEEPIHTFSSPLLIETKPKTKEVGESEKAKDISTKPEPSHLSKTRTRSLIQSGPNSKNSERKAPVQLANKPTKLSSQQRVKTIKRKSNPHSHQ